MCYLDHCASFRSVKTIQNPRMRAYVVMYWPAGRMRLTPQSNFHSTAIFNECTSHCVTRTYSMFWRLLNVCVVNCWRAHLFTIIHTQKSSRLQCVRGLILCSLLCTERVDDCLRLFIDSRQPPCEAVRLTYSVRYKNLIIQFSSDLWLFWTWPWTIVHCVQSTKWKIHVVDSVSTTRIGCNDLPTFKHICSFTAFSARCKECATSTLLSHWRHSRNNTKFAPKQ